MASSQLFGHGVCPNYYPSSILIPMNSSGYVYKADNKSVQSYDLLAIVPFYLIPYDSLTYFLGFDIAKTAQILPLTAVFAPIYLLLRIHSNCKININSREIILPIILLIALFFITFCNIIFESGFQVVADTAFRTNACLRQAVSLLMGIASYYMFLDAASHLTLEKIANTILKASIPSGILVLIQFASGDYRAQGFSSEPSLLGDYLVWAVLPACFCCTASKRIKGVLFGLAMIALLLTLSSTSYMKALGLAIILCASRGLLVKGVLAVSFSLMAGFLILSLEPNNYVFNNLTDLYNVAIDGATLTSFSLVDRFFSLSGPLSMLNQVHAWLGYGLGGDSVYFKQLFKGDILEMMLEYRGEVLQITALQGKMLMYGGVWGYALYLAIWIFAWRSAPKQHIARTMLPALFLGSLFSLGALFLPYLWMWLAIAAMAASQTKPHTMPAQN
jgi:hypothetical protein